MLRDWTLSVRGAIVRIDRTDVDKTLRHPKYVYTFVVRPEEPVTAPVGATLPGEIPIRVAAADLERMVGGVWPGVGDRVEMSARTHGPRPTAYTLTEVRLLSQ